MPLMFIALPRTLLAASNWPFGVLLAVPVLIALLLPAFALGRTSRQRVSNMLLGLFGSMATMFAVLHVTFDPDHPMADIPITPVVVAMVVGAAIGVVLSFVIVKGATRLGLLPGVRNPASKT